MTADRTGKWPSPQKIEIVTVHNWFISNNLYFFVRFYLTRSTRIVQIEESVFVVKKDNMDQFIFYKLYEKTYYFTIIMFQLGLYDEELDSLKYSITHF